MARVNSKKLITLVHARPALWDQKHDDYNNKAYVRQIWEEIAERMDSTAEICKLKWRSLRDVYRRELKKYQSRLNDPNKMDKNLPRWFYFRELQFLTEHLSGIENMEYPPEMSEEYLDLYVKSEPELLDDEDLTNLETEDDILLTLNDSKQQSTEDKNVKYFPDSSKKSDYSFQFADTNKLEENWFERSIKYKRCTGYHNEDRSRKRVKAMDKSDGEDDSDYHFLMSLLPFLKAIPQRRKMFVRTKIQNVFCEEMEAENSKSDNKIDKK